MFPYVVLFEFYYTRMAHWRWHVLTDSVIATAAMASMMKKKHVQKQHIRENIVEKRNQIALWDLQNCSICYINFYCWPPRLCIRRYLLFKTPLNEIEVTILWLNASVYLSIQFSFWQSVATESCSLSFHWEKSRLFGQIINKPLYNFIPLLPFERNKRRFFFVWRESINFCRFRFHVKLHKVNEIKI